MHTFDEWANASEPRLRRAFVASYGLDVGADVTAEAMAYAWEHWTRLRTMDNPTGYLFRVGQSAARRSRRPSGLLPVPPQQELPNVEPRLIDAVNQLTESQRICVVLVHAFGWSQQEVADVLGVSHSTVRTHLARGIASLRLTLEVDHVS